eukprot:Skav226862  [mRNA]  locus=scaffold455:447718:448426:- [translate_table: standard]
MRFVPTAVAARTATLWLDSPKPSTRGEASEARSPEVQFTPWQWQNATPQLCQSYGVGYVSLVQHWLTHVHESFGFEPSSSEEQPQWVAGYQLFLDFQLSTGHAGPSFQSGGWVTHDSTVAVVPISFKVRCRWWTRVLANILAQNGSVVVRKWTRPMSDILCLHTGCFLVVWPRQRLKVVEEWFGRMLKSPGTRAGKVLYGLAPAARDDLLAMPR